MGHERYLTQAAGPVIGADEPVEHIFARRRCGLNNPAVLEAHRTARAYSFAEDDWGEFELIERESLASGTRFAGPAIVMEATATSYIDAGFSGLVHDSGALILTDTLG